MTLLQNLTQTAMLGIPPGADKNPAAVLEVLDSDLLQISQVVRGPAAGPEELLLAAAAISGLASAAGYAPASVSVPAILPAGKETLQALSASAARLLQRMLAGEFSDVLPEFLRLAAQNQMHLLPETLPALLELGKGELRPLLKAVIGVRGRWLAAQNPDWAGMLERDPQDAWEHGMRSERLEALEHQRAANPQQARAWVQSTWAQDAPEDRAAFVSAFSIRLSMDDEPFLENCLDDRRKEVRSAALELLTRLPQSRLVQRMLVRLENVLKLKTKFLGGITLEVHLPDESDAAIKRDLPGAMSLPKKMGEKALGLAHMLAAVPPSIWSQKWGKTPENLVHAALDSEWKIPLILGFWLATLRARDADWAEALAILRLKQGKDFPALEGQSLGALAAILSASQVENLAVTFIRPPSSELDDTHPLLGMLEACAYPWSARMARSVIRSAQRRSGEYGYLFPQKLPRFARWIPVELANEFERGWTTPPRGQWVDRIGEFLAVLHFRQEMIDTFKR